MDIPSYIVTIGLIAILAVLVKIALDVSEVRRLLSTKFASGERYSHTHLSPGAVRVAAFSVWAYKQNQWLLVQECGQAGCQCGPAPDRPGRFEGEVVRKECPAVGTS